MMGRDGLPSRRVLESCTPPRQPSLATRLTTSRPQGHHGTLHRDPPHAFKPREERAMRRGFFLAAPPQTSSVPWPARRGIVAPSRRSVSAHVNRRRRASPTALASLRGVPGPMPTQSIPGRGLLFLASKGTPRSPGGALDGHHLLQRGETVRLGMHACRSVGNAFGTGVRMSSTRSRCLSSAKETWASRGRPGPELFKAVKAAAAVARLRKGSLNYGWQ